MRRNMPDPIPVMVLGRLAVDRHYQDRGIGSSLLRDAILRVLQVAEIAGVKAILVHAISDEAKAYYLAKGFLESPIQPMTLCLALDTARQALVRQDSRS
jgi:predicted N-acetyltransferase YhbS